MAFGYYKALTLDHTQCGSADSANWPLAICLDGTVYAADNDLRTVANGGHVQSATGLDIRPYDSSGVTAYDYELVNYDATTGKLEMHVRIPNLTFGSDTTLRLYYGDSSIVTDGSSTAAWNSGYVLVSHYGTSSSLVLKDSTASPATLTANGSIGAAAGEMFGGTTSNGNNGWYIDAGNDIKFDLGTTLTLQLWFKYRILNGQNPEVLIAKGTGGGGEAYVLDSSGSNWRFFFRDGGGTPYICTGSYTQTGNWENIAATYDGVTQRLYKNGVQKDTNAASATPTTNTHFITSPARQSGSGAYDLTFDGNTDEWRVSNVARSVSYLLADYNSQVQGQSAGTSFIAWGVEQTVSSTPAIAPMIAQVGSGYFVGSWWI